MYCLMHITTGRQYPGSSVIAYTSRVFVPDNLVPGSSEFTEQPHLTLAENVTATGRSFVQ